jgi:hypothetical protein
MFQRDMGRTKIGKTEAFAFVFDKKFPELTLLIGLLGDKLPMFLDIFEGKTLQIPSKGEIREVALAAEALSRAREHGLEACLEYMSSRYGMSKERVYELILNSKEY